MRLRLLFHAQLVAMLCSSWAFAQQPAGHFNRVAHVATAVPRAVGRTTKNMFLFKDPRLAVAQWVNVAAVVVDNWTTLDGERRCTGCVEKNTFGISRLTRLSTFQIALQTGALAFIETTTDQYAGEQIDRDGSFWWRQGVYVLPGFFTQGHLRAAAKNYSIPSDAAAVKNGLVLTSPAKSVPQP